MNRKIHLVQINCCALTNSFSFAFALMSSNDIRSVTLTHSAFWNALIYAAHCVSILSLSISLMASVLFLLFVPQHAIFPSSYFVVIMSFELRESSHCDMSIRIALECAFAFRCRWFGTLFFSHRSNFLIPIWSHLFCFRLVFDVCGNLYI